MRSARASSAEDRRSYAEKGYLVVRALFDAGRLREWSERFEAIAKGALPRPREMLVMRDVMVAKGAVKPATRLEEIAKIQDFHRDEVLFPGYAKDPGLLDVVERFTGPDIKCVHNMLINKPPGVDGRHPMHQDLLYFPFRPAERIVASWTALEPCTRENGCLAVVPGSHRGELLPHEAPGWEYVNYLYVAARGVGAPEDRVHLEMQPGDTVFFHPLLLHGSGRNRSQGFRRAISAHFASAACRFVEGQSPIGRGRPYVLVRGREHAGCI